MAVPLRTWQEVRADYVRITAGLYDKEDDKVGTSVRSGVLRQAELLITGDRNHHYGPPDQDFNRTAGILNALGYRGPDGRELTGHDVAILLIAVKLSRITWSPEETDHWVDLAGYAACGYECVTEQKKRKGDRLYGNKHPSAQDLGTKAGVHARRPAR